MLQQEVLILTEFDSSSYTNTG